MDYKKVMLAAIVLLAVLTIGAVSASQDANDVTAVDLEDGGVEITDSPVDESEGIACGSEDEAVADYNPNKENVTLTIYRPNDTYWHDEFNICPEVEPVADEWEEYPSGDIVLYLNGEEIERSDYVGVEFCFSVEEFGVYNFRVEYEGDDNYNGAFEEFTYNVTNTKYVIQVPESVEYGANTFPVYAPVANPTNIEITINGKKFNVCEDYGDFYCNASALNYGLNTVEVYYPGDDVFGQYSSIKNITFESYIGWGSESYILGEPVDVFLNLPSDATGTLAVYIRTYDEWGDYKYVELGSAQVKNGNATVTLNNLPVGIIELRANFTGSVEVGSTTFYINVNPIVTVPKTMLTGENAVVSVKTSEGANGKVIVMYRDANDYEDEDHFLASKDIEGTLTEVPLSGLKQGHYEIWTGYQYGDDDFDTFGFNHYLYVVDKYDIALNITDFNDKVVVDRIYNYVYFSIAPYADGVITLYIDGKAVDNTTAEISDCLCYSSQGLSLGEHNFSVNFTSEVQGNSSDADKFNVAVATIYIPDESNINSVHMSANNIEVHVSNNATGIADVLIDNKLFATKYIDAAADEQIYYVFLLNNVSRGKHNVTVIYNDDKYGRTVENKTVDFGYEIQIDAEWLYGKDNIITLNLPNDFGNGNLDITIDGNKVSGTRNESEVKVNPHVLDMGNHTVVVKYAGDSIYPADEFNRTFEVCPEIQIPRDEVLAESDSCVSLMLPGDAKGMLNVVVEYEEDAEWYVYCDKDIPFENGKAYFSFAELPIGDYHVSARYTANDYVVEDASSYFEVMPIDWGKYYLKIGENKTITFISENETLGQLHIVLSKMVDEDLDWDDPVNVLETVYLNFTGKATYTFSNLKYGYYYIFIAEEYIGGGLKGYHGGQSFEVTLPDVEVETGEFVIGTIPSMVIDFPNGADGKVTVIVDANYTNEVPDLYAIVDIPVNGQTTVDLNKIIVDVGQFRVHFNYTGNYGEFESQNYGYEVTPAPVVPISANLTATANDIKQGQTAVIDISLNANATGRVFVGDSEVTITDGKGKFEIPGLAVGTYTRTVTFAGDELFLNDSVTVSFEVTTDPVVTAKDTTVQYTANGVFSVTVKGTDGKLANGAEVIFKINGKQVAKTKTNANGVASFSTAKQVPGKYNVVATALGASGTKKLTVKSIVTLKSTTVKKSAKKLTLQAKLAKVNGKYLKGKKVTFKFNGKKYTAKTNAKGVAKYILKSTKLKKVLKKLKVGKKVTYQATYLKDTVKKTAKVKK